MKKPLTKTQKERAANPDKERERSRLARRKDRAKGTAKKICSSAKTRLKTGEDITRILERAVDRLLKCETDEVTRTRTLAYVCGVAIKAVEVTKQERALAILGDGLGIPVIMMPPPVSPEAKKSKK